MASRVPRWDSDGLLAIPPPPHCPICWQPQTPIPTEQTRHRTMLINRFCLAIVAVLVISLVVSLARLMSGSLS